MAIPLFSAGRKLCAAPNRELQGVRNIGLAEWMRQPPGCRQL
jgi:hypothetical protein